MMKQKEAVEKAWAAAAKAQEAADRPGVILSFDDACKLAAAWIAVASQLEFIPDAPAVPTGARDVMITMPIERPVVGEETRTLPVPLMCDCDRRSYGHPWSVSAGCPRA